MKLYKKILSLFASMTVLFMACSDSSSVSAEKWSLSVVSSLDDLPECSQESAGVEVFVESEDASYVCTSKRWLVSATNNTRKITASVSCLTEKLADGSGVKIVCGGDSIGVVLNGAKGAQGDQGPKGDPGKDGENGATGAKGNKGATGDRGATGDSGTDGVNGVDGDRGATGKSCTVETLDDNSGLKVLCGGDSLGVVKNGVNGTVGDPGKSCTMENLLDGSGLKFICGGDSVAVVHHGKSGFSCSVDQLANGQGYKVLCDGDSVGVITNGENGLGGTDAKNGAGCTVAPVENTLNYKIVCGEDSVGVLKNEFDEVTGLNKKDGISCNVQKIDDKSGYKVVCGSDSVGVIKDGKNGKNGYDCGMTPLNDGSGYKVVCNNDSIGVVMNGHIGSVCSMEELANGLGLKIVCGGDSVGVLLNTLGSCNGWREGAFEKVKENDYVCNKGEWVPLTVCSSTNVGEVVRFGDYYFTCLASGWVRSTSVEYDTDGVECSTDNVGSVKAGTVNTDAYYYCTGTLWREASEVEYDTYGEKCSTAGLVLAGKVNTDAYYYCTGTVWRVATEIEIDTYGWENAPDGTLKKGSVSEKSYVFDSVKTTWRLADFVERKLGGGCNKARNKEVVNFSSSYYICSNREWFPASMLEYDVYGLKCSNDGSDNGKVVHGNVTDTAYYYCNNGSWKTATVLQRDVYGVDCSKDGKLFAGKVNDSLKYVCDDGVFREADSVAREIEVGLGCTSYTNGASREEHYGDFWYANNTCTDGTWKITDFAAEENQPYGTLTDERDGKSYKTVQIGSQTWMAENLNYYKSSDRSLDNGRAVCYDNLDSNCDKYGRLYTWSAAMDTARTECGYKAKTCNPKTLPPQGICPDGWHLPTNDDWNQLFIAVGEKGTDSKWSTRLLGIGQNIGGKMLKSTTDDWIRSNNMGECSDDVLGRDAFGFSALPSGERADNKFFSNLKSRALFWSATEDERDNASAHIVYMDWAESKIGHMVWPKNMSYSIRCVKD